MVVGAEPQTRGSAIRQYDVTTTFSEIVSYEKIPENMQSTKKRTVTGKPKKAYRGGKYRQSFGYAVNTPYTYQRGRELARPGQELKAFDVAATTTALDPPGGPPNFATNLNCPINGAELYQRIGRKTYGKSIHLRGWFTNVATSLQDLARLIVYFDSQPNAGAPLIGDIIRDSNAAGAVSIFSEINLINRQRFQILRDKQFNLPACTNTAGVLTNLAYPDTTGCLQVNEFIKLKGLETVFNSTNGGTVADISSGAIGFVVLNESNNNAWDFIWGSRYRYYD